MDLHLPGQRVFRAPPVLWKRFFAFVIDLLILDLVIGGAFQPLLVKMIPEGSMAGYTYLTQHPRTTLAISLVLFLYGCLALLYFALMEYKLRTTIGKMVFGIQVVTERIGFLPFALRSLGFLFVFPFALLWILDLVFIMIRRDSRRFSELLSGTATVASYVV